MRRIRGLFFAIILLPALVMAQPECQSSGTKFAHCPQATRNFYSALVAVHGWNGSCDSTFGTQDHSLAQILGPHKFYDWDCFGYDSRHVSIEENARRLRQQLAQLKRNGYRKILLVTHSTGGILALQLIADEFADSAQLPDDVPTIAEVLAWATPINGLRRIVSGPGSILTKIGFSPDTLPDLSPDSAYLKNLKHRLWSYNQRYLTADNVTKGKLEIRVYFYQGQGDDMVVQAIDPKSAEKEGWYWPPPRGKVVDTQEGHTHNVGASGTTSTPRYPADLIDLKTLISLPVSPRYGDVFPVVPLVTQTLENRQIEVIDGLTYFAEENFTGAFTPSLDFLRRMYQESFARSRTVDDKLVLDFLAVLKKRCAQPDDDLVRFFDSFVKKVLGGYNVSSGQDIRTLGHGSSPIAKAILETAETIRQTVMAYNASHPDNADLLPNYHNVNAINADLVGIEAQFLKATHGPVQYAALSTLESALPDLPDSVIEQSGMLPAINGYYLAGGYRNLSGDGKSKIANLLPNYHNVNALNADLVRIEAQFLKSTHGPVQYAALSTLESALPDLPDSVVEQSGMLPAINGYYLAGGYRNLSGDAKSKIAKIYTNIVARNSSLQTQTLAALNTKVPYLQEQRPAWVALGDDLTVGSMLGAIKPQPGATNREQVTFVAAVASRAGATGKDLQTALAAVDVGQKIIETTGSPELRQEHASKLRQAVAKSEYPRVQKSLSPPGAAAESLGVGRTPRRGTKPPAPR